MITLDAAKLTKRAEAHAYLKEILSLPDYYGRNLDALYDCLSGLNSTDVRFVNLDAAAGSYFAKILPVFREAEAENPSLRIFYDFG